MAKTIEAKAVVSAKDNTGNTFDKIAAKLKGVEKTAKAFGAIKPPQFSGNMYEELRRLNLSEKELQGVRKSFNAFHDDLKRAQPRFSSYTRAIEEWQGKTIDHWRNVKAAVDDTEKSHKRFFKNAGHFALHAAGIGGGVYMAGHAFKAVVKHAVERNREEVREEMAGLTPAETAEASDVADDISKRYPSISRTDVMSDLRKNMSRLGSFDRAVEVSRDYARARIMNTLSGGDEHELEQVVRAAEGAGAANNAAQFREFINGFSKAKANNPDYTGENLRADLAAAGSAKYGWDSDFRENVFPVLASHMSGFGNKAATTNSALVGGRMTKKSRQALKEAGLLDKDGQLVDEKEFQKNPFEWTMSHAKPVLEAKGVHFGEHMSEEDKRTTSGWATKAFSAKNASDSIISYLLDASLVEKARNRKTENIENADHLQKKDAGLAWQGVTTQLLDLGTAAANTSFAISTMNEAATEFGKRVDALRSGDWLKLLPEDDQRIIQNVRDSLNPAKAHDWAQIEDLQKQAYGASDNPNSQDEYYRKNRLKREDILAQVAAIKASMNMPPIFTDKEIKDLRANYVPLPTPDPRRRRPDGARATSPEEDGSDSNRSGMPPVQPLDHAPQRVDVQGTVQGVAKLAIEVRPSSLLEALVQRLENGIKLVGSLAASGPGSTGKSSPDAAAPSTGVGGIGSK